MNLNKKQAQEYIEEFFKNIHNKNREQIRKVKRLAMHYKIRLGEKRKLFCKYCYSAKLKIIKISKNIKTVKCENCGKLGRWKL